MPLTKLKANEIIIDAIIEPDIVSLKKGETASFSGALIPFNTFREYEGYRLNYDQLKKQYELDGPWEERGFLEIRRDAYLFIIFAASGVLAGALVSGADQSVRNVVYGASFVCLVGSLVILTF